MADFAEKSWFWTNKSIALANKLKTRWPLLQIFTRKFYSVMNLTFCWMDMLMNKIYIFRVIIIHTLFMRSRYILRKIITVPFGVFYGQRETLVHISSKLNPIIMLQLMGNTKEPRLMAFLYQYCKMLASTIRRFML